MNELNLNAMGVTEMNNRQMKEVDGGIVCCFLIGLAVGLVGGLLLLAAGEKVEIEIIENN